MSGTTFCCVLHPLGRHRIPDQIMDERLVLVRGGSRASEGMDNGPHASLILSLNVGQVNGDVLGPWALSDESPGLTNTRVPVSQLHEITSGS